MEIFGKSIQGRRNNNQDRIYYLSQNECFILAVADGMGGSRGGEIASKIVIEQCEIIFQNFYKNPSDKKLKSTVNNIYIESQTVLRNMVKDDSKLENMGTTLSIVIGFKQKYVIGNIGDSRTYVLNNGSLNQITIDNSYLQEYINNYPDETIDDYLESKLGHIITKSISAKKDEIDIYPTDEEHFKLYKDDLFLLCSDGLLIYKIKGLTEVFLDIVEKSQHIDDSVEKLINWAYDNGSYDNISVIIGSMKEGTSQL